MQQHAAEPQNTMDWARNLASGEESKCDKRDITSLRDAPPTGQPANWKPRKYPAPAQGLSAAPKHTP